MPSQFCYSKALANAIGKKNFAIVGAIIEHTEATNCNAYDGLLQSAIQNDIPFYKSDGHN